MQSESPTAIKGNPTGDREEMLIITNVRKCNEAIPLSIKVACYLEM